MFFLFPFQIGTKSVSKRLKKKFKFKNKQIHKHKEEKPTYERDTSFGRCNVDGGISRTEKVT